MKPILNYYRENVVSEQVSPLRSLMVFSQAGSLGCRSFGFKTKASSFHFYFCMQTRNIWEFSYHVS